MKILVTGASGFVGRAFRKWVAVKGRDEEWVWVDREPWLDKCPGISVVADLAIPGTISDLILYNRPDRIIHLAGVFGNVDWDLLYRVNVGICREILETVREESTTKRGATRLLVMGSAAEYGMPRELPVRESHPLEPTSAYGLSKAYQTMLCQYYHRNFGIPVVIARPFNLIGDGMSTDLAIGSFMAQISGLVDGGMIKVGNLTARRDYLDVESAIEAFFAILEHAEPGAAINVCHGVSVTIESILGDLISRSGKRISVVQDPERLRQNDVPDIYGDRTVLDSLLRR
jgi:GDP-4-dehydro-6-deoxy-D-mannose reductase